MKSPLSPLVVDDLSIRYRDHPGAPIQNISFTAILVDILLISGANGCGKIMFIRWINALFQPSYKGEVSGMGIGLMDVNN